MSQLFGSLQNRWLILLHHHLAQCLVSNSGQKKRALVNSKYQILNFSPLKYDKLLSLLAIQRSPRLLRVHAKTC